MIVVWKAAVDHREKANLPIIGISRDANVNPTRRALNLLRIVIAHGDMPARFINLFDDILFKIAFECNAEEVIALERVRIQGL